MVYCCASRRVQRTTSGPAVCPTAWSDRPGCGSELVCWLCLPLGAWPLLVCPCKGGGRFTFFTRCQPILWSSADINLLSSDSVKFWRYVPGAGLPRWHLWWRTQLSVQETDAGFDREDFLEEGTTTHSSILAWKTPWTEEPGGAAAQEVTKCQTRLKWLSTHPHLEFVSDSAG